MIMEYGLGREHRGVREVPPSLSTEDLEPPPQEEGRFLRSRVRSRVLTGAELGVNGS